MDAQGGLALAVLPNDEDLIVLERQVPVPALGICLGPHPVVLLVDLCTVPIAEPVLGVPAGRHDIAEADELPRPVGYGLVALLL